MTPKYEARCKRAFGNRDDRGHCIGHIAAVTTELSGNAEPEEAGFSEFWQRYSGIIRSGVEIMCRSIEPPPPIGRECCHFEPSHVIPLLCCRRGRVAPGVR